MIPLSREYQDVGLDGLRNNDEKLFFDSSLLAADYFHYMDPVLSLIKMLLVILQEMIFIILEVQILIIYRLIF